jgi:hypothetical protein
LERQREQYVQQSNEATTKYLQAMEEVKLREMNILELQKKIAEGEAKLKQQQVSQACIVIIKCFRTCMKLSEVIAIFTVKT